MASDEYLKAVDAIQNVNDHDEMLKLNKILRDKFDPIIMSEALKFNVGDEVTFKTRKGIIKGEVTKINRKTVNVLDVDSMKWRVSPSFLEKI